MCIKCAVQISCWWWCTVQKPNWHCS